MTPDDPTPPRLSDPIFPADPRLTAYAFGELEGEDLALIEAALANDEMLRAVVDDLRAFGGDLTNSLAAEIESENKDEHRNESPVSETPAVTLAHSPADKTALTKHSAGPKRRGVLLRFPFTLSYLAPALAACLAVVFWTQSDNEAQRERGRVAPVSFALQVADAPNSPAMADATNAANGANVASIVEVAGAKIEAVRSVAFSPVPPSSPQSFSAVPPVTFGSRKARSAAIAEPAPEALMEHDVTAPLLAASASTASVLDGATTLVAHESTANSLADPRVQEASTTSSTASAKTMTYAEFSARSASKDVAVHASSRAKSSPVFKAARADIGNASATQVSEKLVPPSQASGGLGGSSTSSVRRIVAWDKVVGWDTYGCMPGPRPFFSARISPDLSMSPSWLSLEQTEQRRAWNAVLDDQAREEFLNLLWGNRRVNRIRLDAPLFKRDSEADHTLPPWSVTPLIDWSLLDNDSVPSYENYCTG